MSDISRKWKELVRLKRGQHRFVRRYLCVDAIRLRDHKAMLQGQAMGIVHCRHMAQSYLQDHSWMCRNCGCVSYDQRTWTLPPSIKALIEELLR